LAGNPRRHVQPKPYVSRCPCGYWRHPSGFFACFHGRSRAIGNASASRRAACESFCWPGAGALTAMANVRPRGSSIFSGLLLVSVGVILLLHNCRGLDLGLLFFRWWPLLLIFLGVIKLYERAVAARAGNAGAARISFGEVFLVIGLIALVGAVHGVDI